MVAKSREIEDGARFFGSKAGTTFGGRFPLL
jgi:hypothetical protein